MSICHSNPRPIQGLAPCLTTYGVASPPFRGTIIYRTSLSQGNFVLFLRYPPAARDPHTIPSLFQGRNQGRLCLRDGANLTLEPLGRQSIALGSER